MNLTKDLEKVILGARMVFFQIEPLQHPYNKLQVDIPSGFSIDTVLGFIRVPSIVIEEIKRAPTGGPIVSTALGGERKIELLFFNWWDVKDNSSFIDVLSEKFTHAEPSLWVFAPKNIMVRLAEVFVGTDPENVSIYRSYDRYMKPYVLTFEKNTTEQEASLGFYCRSFRA